MSDPASVYTPALPASTTAVVLSGFPPSVDYADEIARMLGARGYQVTSSLGTIMPAMLRRPAGQPIGVFYLMSHGLIDLPDVAGDPSQLDDNAPPITTLTFGIATTQLATDPRSAEDLADLNARPPRLIASTFPQMSRGPDGKIAPGAVVQVLYATRDFFDHYWGPGTFASGSLVCINGCYGADSGFQSICNAAGAGLLLGWPQSVIVEDATATAAYLFDRLLGTNNTHPPFHAEPMRQRPFTWPQVQQTFGAYQSGLGNPLGTSVFTDEDKRVQKFALEALVENQSGLLVPSITFVAAVELTGQLMINGNFGPDPGSDRAVVMSASLSQSGSPLQIQSWTPNLITCSLPAGSGDAGESCGYVTVVVNGRTSNCVPLTKFSGRITVQATGDGSLQNTVTIECRHRMACHPVRMRFSSAKLTGDDYGSIPRTAMTSRDSTLTYAASGTAYLAISQATQNLSGGGSIQPTSLLMPPPPGPPTTFDVFLRLDPKLDLGLAETHTLTLALSVGQVTNGPGDFKYAIQLTTTTPDQPPTTSQQDAVSFCNMFGPVTLLQDATTFDIPDPAKTLDPQGGLLPNATLHVSLSATCPPDPTLGEDYLPVLS